LSVVGAALAEAARVVRLGGRVIAAEPDNLGQRFYIDGPLDPLTTAVHGLTSRVRRARLPADIAIGPRVASSLVSAGLRGVISRVHAVHR
jgi:hypothetical protein